MSLISLSLFSSDLDPFSGWTHEFVEQCLISMPDVRDKKLDNYGCNEENTGDWSKTEIYASEASPLHFSRLDKQIVKIIQGYESKYTLACKSSIERIRECTTRRQGPAYIVGAKKSLGNSVVSFGDNHGGFKTFADYFMQRTNNDFFIKDEYKNEQYVFLGDIINRGPASVASLFFVLMLQYKNPEQVTIIRGNHETTGLAGQHDNLWSELKYLFADKASLYLSIASIFPYLPVGIFWCHKDIGKTDLYSHGLFDFSFNFSSSLEQLKNEPSKNEIYALHGDYHRESLFLYGDFFPDRNEIAYKEEDWFKNRFGGQEARITSQNIQEYSEKHGGIRYFINGHQHCEYYRDLTPVFCANCFHARFRFENGSTLIRQGMCCCSGYAQPNEESEFPGFIQTSVVKVSENGVSIIVLPNTKTTSEESRRKFANIYAKHLQKHMKEHDFSTNQLKISLFSYLNGGFLKLYGKLLKDASDVELRNYLYNYATVEKEYIAFHYDHDGNCTMYYQDEHNDNEPIGQNHKTISAEIDQQEPKYQEIVKVEETVNLDKTNKIENNDKEIVAESKIDNNNTEKTNFFEFKQILKNNKTIISAVILSICALTILNYKKILNFLKPHDNKTSH